MAEKKSTKGKARLKVSEQPTKKTTGTNKPQVVSVKIEPQSIEIKQEKAKEKVPSIWTILGESSLVLALVTAILFVIGWAYEANWYTYFGISAEKVNISVPQVLIRSIPIVFIVFMVVLISYIVLSLIYFLLFVITTIFKINLSLKRLSEEKWWFIFGLSLILTYFSAVFIFPFRNWGNYLDLVSQLPFEGFSLIPIGVFLGVTLIFISPFLIYPPTRLIIIVSFSTKTNQMILTVIFSFFYLFAILSMASSLAFYDASTRRKGISATGSLQEVLLVSPKSLSFVKDLEKSCDANENCVYGPFALLDENDNSFILIKGDQTTTNSQKPELYIFPRSDPSGSYLIIPASAPIPTVTPQPTVTVTMTPSPSILATTTSTQ